MFFADRKSRNTTTGTGWALNQKVYCDAIAKLGVKHKHWPFCLKAKGQSETAICFISTWPWCLLPPLLRQHIFHWILLWRVLEAQILMTCLDLVLFAPTARTRFRAVRFTWFHDIPKSSCLCCIVFPPSRSSYPLKVPLKGQVVDVCSERGRFISISVFVWQQQSSPAWWAATTPHWRSSGPHP